MQKLTRVFLILLINLSLSTIVLADDTLQGQSTVTVTIIEGEKAPQNSHEPQPNEGELRDPTPPATTPSTDTRPSLPKTNEAGNFKFLQLIGIYLLFLIALYKKNRNKKENKNERI